MDTIIQFNRPAFEARIATLRAALENAEARSLVHEAAGLRIDVALMQEALDALDTTLAALQQMAEQRDDAASMALQLASERDGSDVRGFAVPSRFGTGYEWTTRFASGHAANEDEARAMIERWRDVYASRRVLIQS